MKTLILLAGQSTRFWPLTEKPLFPIAGKPLLSHIVDRLTIAGCNDIILIGGKHNLEEVATLYPAFPLIEQETLGLGMRGALLSALPQLKDEDILVVGGNDVIDAAGYEATIHAGRKAAGAILAQKVDRYFPGGYLSVDGDRVVSIVEKPGEGKEPSNLVNIVCHYHRSASTLLEALERIDDATDDGYGYERALDQLFKKEAYAAVPYEGNWQAVKYPWHLLHLLPIVLADLKKQAIHTSAHIHTSAVIEGPVVIGEGVRVLPHACIVGPAVIGPHSIIGNNALVRGSSIGEHCVIGYNTEVKGSVLGHHVWTHSTYIGDSVVASNVSFGAGSATGNLRLDEAEIESAYREESIATGLMKFGTIIGSDCRIGIHTSIAPGVKIGRGSFIASATFVDRDIADNCFVKMKNGVLDVRANESVAPAPEGREKFSSAAETAGACPRDG